MRLHLGCGRDLREGWINVDKVLPCDVQADFTEGLPFRAASVDAITMTCVLPLLPRPVWDRFVWELARVLKPGGEIEILDHQIDACMQAFLTNRDDARWSRWAVTIWGDEQYGWYHWGLTEDRLKDDLSRAGFERIGFLRGDPLTLEAHAWRG